MVSCSLFIHLSKSRLTLSFRKETTFTDLSLPFYYFISPTIFKQPLNKIHKKVLPLPDKKKKTVSEGSVTGERLFRIMYEQKIKTQQISTRDLGISTHLEVNQALVSVGAFRKDYFPCSITGCDMVFIPSSQRVESTFPNPCWRRSGPCPKADWLGNYLHSPLNDHIPLSRVTYRQTWNRLQPSASHMDQQPDS